MPAPFTTPATLPPLPSRRSPWRSGTLLTGAVVVAVVAALLVAGGLRARPAKSAAPGPSAVASATVSPAQAAAAAVNLELAAQSRALLSGDLSGYLAPVDAGLRDEFTVRFG
ncbi:hypothetical protein [Dactylosporangium sp. CA-139066]|uniref:hypothetical protein n=1 Tax=Dactylosporangium sp. CA-139066 TaxID=3239930 RepID=UPI003D89EE26